MALPQIRSGLPWGQQAITLINNAIAKILDASDTVAGLIELATDAEAQAETATDRALTPKNLAALDASTTFAGLIEIATDVEAAAVTATDKALVPSNFSGKAGQQTYTESTWTPVLTFGGGSTGITYSSQNGRYTRVGRLYAVTAQIVLTSKGTSTGSMSIAGLPAQPWINQPLGLRAHLMTSGVGDTYLAAIAQGGATTIILQKIASGNVSTLTDADFTNSTQLQLCGVYVTT